MFDDWCRRNPDLAFMLGIVVFVAGMLGLLFAFRAILPQTADAKPVKTPTPTVSCTADHSNDYKDSVDECKVTLKDGRTVTCVNIAKGTSCDWAHATTKKGR